MPAGDSNSLNVDVACTDARFPAADGDGDGLEAASSWSTALPLLTATSSPLLDAALPPLASTAAPAPSPPTVLGGVITTGLPGPSTLSLQARQHKLMPEDCRHARACACS